MRLNFNSLTLLAKTPLKLNLGCGETKREGYVNIDKRADVIPDITLAIGEEEFPFPNNIVEEIYASHSLEHFPNLLFVIDELARISKNKCKWHFITPYFSTSKFNLINPFHVNHFSEHTFRFWDDIYEREKPRNYTIETVNVKFDYNNKFWGNHSAEEWELLRQKHFNVVDQITFNLVLYK